MSSRHLRKLREQKARQQTLLSLEADSAPQQPSDFEPEIIESRPRVSLFALVDVDEASHVTSDQENIDSDQDDVEESVVTSALQESPVVTSPEPAKKKSRKKKKSKKKKGKKADEVKVEERVKDDEDEIEKALRELDAQDAKKGRVPAIPNKTAVTPADTESSGAIDHLFAIQTKYLKERNEMIAVFGRDVIDTMDNLNGPPRAPRPGEDMTVEDVLRVRGGEKLPEVTLRRNPFIEGKETWPKGSVSGMTMEKVKTREGGVTEYAFSGEGEFREVQRQFFSLVQIGDLQSMVRAVMEYPYHIMFLLQCYLIVKEHEKNAALAADLTQRALFTFGRVTLSAFRKDIERGSARLSARRPENRRFFLAGYRNVRALVLKGALRTAFEWAKLLFSLAPDEDPVGMHHVLHMLAVRSRNPQWLLDFVDSKAKNPSWELKGELKYYRHSVVPALVQLGREEEAEAMLPGLIEEMPWLYCRLFQVLCLNAPPSIWGQEPPTDADRLITELYVSYGKELWGSLEILTMLKRSAAVARKGAQTIVTGVEIDLRTTRFVYLEADTEMMGLLPTGSLAVEPNYDFDPLPPAEEDNVFVSDIERIPWKQSRVRGTRRPTERLDWSTMGAAGELARSLFENGLGGTGQYPDADAEMQFYLQDMLQMSQQRDRLREAGPSELSGYQTPRVEEAEDEED